MTASASVPDAKGDDVVISGGPIVRVDAPTLPDGAVVVRDGRIAEVVADARSVADRPGRRVDLAGRSLLPGFIDAHCHLSVSALHPRFGDASGVTAVDELDAVLRAHAHDEPDVAFVRLHGWDDTKCDFVLDRHVVDAICERPVIVAHSSLHQCVANSAALDALGIGRTTVDPSGGAIERDASGEPTGLLGERAWSDAHARSVREYADPDRWAELVAARARLMIRSGVTAVHDAACSPEAEALFGAMAAAGTLPVSVLAMPHPSALLRNEHDARLDGAPSGAGDERFRIGAFKLFADGGIAIALDVAMGGHRIQHGYLMDDLEECARRAADRGFRIAVHAIGNVGVEHALATFRSVARSHPGLDHRFRLEHAGVTSPAQWRAAADLGVVGVVQPGFVEHVGISSQGVRFDDHHWLAFGGLHEAGVVLAGSSDDPCAPLPPLWCIDRGMTRTTSTGIVFEADQSLPFADWLHAYTLGAAYAGGQENERGSITAGKVADFVELAESGDERRVVATWVRGVREATIDATP